MGLRSDTEGFYQELITGSPGAVVFYHDNLSHRSACPPMNTSLANVRQITRPSSAATDGISTATQNTASLVDEPLCFMSQSIFRPQCNRPYMAMFDVAARLTLTEQQAVLGGQGGYSVYYLYQRYVCDIPVSPAKCHYQA
jgi:hypothetical protein